MFILSFNQIYIGTIEGESIAKISINSAGYILSTRPTFYLSSDEILISFLLIYKALRSLDNVIRPFTFVNFVI
jgi:hypothetical protein